MFDQRIYPNKRKHSFFHCDYSLLSPRWLICSDPDKSYKCRGRHGWSLVSLGHKRYCTRPRCVNVPGLKNRFGLKRSCGKIITPIDVVRGHCVDAKVGLNWYFWLRDQIGICLSKLCWYVWIVVLLFQQLLEFIAASGHLIHKRMLANNNFDRHFWLIITIIGS